MSLIFYILCMVILIFSFLRDKNKTKTAIKNTIRSFESIMPQFLFIIIIVSIILSSLDPKTLSSFLGKESGLFGVIFASVVGSITMMPTFVAFSTGDSLLNNGAGYAQVAALISTLTMVGVLTFSLEAKYIGKQAAFFRNLFAFLFSFIVAFFVGGVLG